MTSGAATIAPPGSGTRFALSGYCGAGSGLCTPARLADGLGASPPTALASLCGR